MRKIIVSLTESDLRIIDAAARRAGQTRSSFVRRAALAEAHRGGRPIDDPDSSRASWRLLRRAQLRKPLSTAEVLEAPDRERR